MANERTSELLGIWALNATTVIPGTPISGTAYRDTTTTASFNTDGHLFNTLINSPEWNQSRYNETLILNELDKRGSLGWNVLIAYTDFPAYVRGSDGLIYKSTASSTGVDPVGDLTGTWVDAAPPFNLVDDITPQLGGNLDLNGFTIPGLSFDLVNDTTPQLGGDLDLNSSDITGTGNIAITGDVNADSVNGDMVAASAEIVSGTANNKILTPSGSRALPTMQKRYVLFNQIGVLSVLDSYGVASVTDIGLGASTVTFDTSEPWVDVNYLVAGYCRSETNKGTFLSSINTSLKTTASMQFITAKDNGDEADSSEVSILFSGRVLEIINEILIGGSSNTDVYLSKDGSSFSSVVESTGASGIRAFNRWISASSIVRYSNTDGAIWLTGAITGPAVQVMPGSQQVAFDGTTVVFIDKIDLFRPSIIHSTDGINFTQLDTLNVNGGDVISVIAHDPGSANPWLTANISRLSPSSDITQFLISNDGLTWSGSPTFFSNFQVRGLAFNGSDWIAVNNALTDIQALNFAESLDGGLNWTLFAHGIDLLTYNDFGEIVFVGGLYVMNAFNFITNKATILTSATRTSWTERVLPGVAVGGTLNALSHSANTGLFFTVGQDGVGNGISYSSPDALTWTALTLIPSANALDYIAVR